ncbi:hypothetical protein [Calothrix rhizosoleniae]|uniref:hypothetical protein n=1 Tax=Calothrix rhizosoleniae TaxID=888997 RepID=UPI000B4A4DDC|nr:hypothetical protein [Calothrix rhizosoleniae]
MNYQKLDGSLAMALNDVMEPETPNLVVFIHTQSPLEPDAIAILENKGVNNITDSQDIFTATVSADTIAQLSEQSWVRYLKLSHKLRLANRA